MTTRIIHTVKTKQQSWMIPATREPGKTTMTDNQNKNFVLRFHGVQLEDERGATSRSEVSSIGEEKCGISTTIRFVVSGH